MTPIEYQHAEIKINDPKLMVTRQPSSEVYQPMEHDAIWQTPGVYLAQTVLSQKLVRFVGEKIEQDYTQVIVVVDNDPDDLLDKVFDAEHEMYEKFKGLRFDVRVQVLGSKESIETHKKSTFVYYDREKSID